MYPEVTFINPQKNNLVIFEKDISNPENEGFVGYWEINDTDDYKLVFKKRLTKKNAIAKFKNLIKEGWENTNFINKAA